MLYVESKVKHLKNVFQMEKYLVAMKSDTNSKLYVNRLQYYISSWWIKALITLMAPFSNVLKYQKVNLRNQLSHNFK